MSIRVILSPRDRSLLRLLSWTPATTSMLFRASAAFDGEPFGDERRLRERLQSLHEAGIVRSWATGYARGGLQNYYKLTPMGFDLLSGPDAARPSRTFFDEVSPSLVEHTFRLAETIVETSRACHAKRITIVRFIRENELTFVAGDDQVQPDCFFRLTTAGMHFNLAFEIDNSTESLDSNAFNSVRRKLAVYHAYQDGLLSKWITGGKCWERPRFRIVFLTRSIARANHILVQAAETARNKSRRLVYAAPHETFITDLDPLAAPIFVDHFGHWQSLVDLHPTAQYRKAPIRLTQYVDHPFGVC